MIRAASRRRDVAALDRDLGRLYRSVQVRAVPEHLKGLLDQLEAGPPVAKEKRT